MMEQFLLDKIVSRGHLSILEHLYFTFGIDGISRVTSHQEVRHRHISIAQKSQRYTGVDVSNYLLPNNMENDSECHESIQKAIELYKKLVKEDGYSPEDARYVLPNACTTSLVLTANGRSLIEMSRKRMCSHAQEEIRFMFQLMKKAVSDFCPLIANYMGKPCEFGNCPEGTKEKCN